MSGHRGRSHAGGSTGTGTYARSLRVNQVLRQVLAEELERLADADERLRLLTVTAVETAPDLRHATVYVASLEADAAEALDERRSQLQAAVGRQVRMKRTPVLQFAADPGVSAGERVEEVLRRLGSGPGSASGSPSADDSEGGEGGDPSASDGGPGRRRKGPAVG